MFSLYVCLKTDSDSVHGMLLEKVEWEKIASKNIFVLLLYSTPVVLTISALPTEIDICANCLDPDKMACNEPSHLMCTLCQPVIDFWLKPLFDTSTFKDGIVHFRNPRVNIYHAMGKFSRQQTDDIFLIFSMK